MKYILDTENFRALVTDPKSLCEKTISILKDPENTVFVSNISILEVKNELESNSKTTLNINELYEKTRIHGLRLMEDHSEAKSLLFLLPNSKRCETLYRFLSFQASRHGLTLVSKSSPTGN